MCELKVIASDFFSQSTTVEWTIENFLEVATQNLSSEVFHAQFSTEFKFKLSLEVDSNDSDFKHIGLFLTRTGLVRRPVNIGFSFLIINEKGQSNLSKADSMEFSISASHWGYENYATRAQVNSALIEKSLKFRVIVSFREAGEFFSTPNKIMSRLKTFYDMIDGKFADFEISAGDKIINVHKTMLKELWPHFATMVDTPMEESKKNIWYIDDHSYDTIKAIVVYMYTGMVAFQNCDVARKILSAAHQYMIDELMDLCVKHMEKFLKIENAFEALALAQTLDNESLKEVCYTLLISAKKENAAKYKKLTDYPDYDQFSTTEMAEDLCATFLNAIHM